MARYGYNPATGANDYQDYVVPAGHFALVRTITGSANGATPHVDVDEGAGFYQVTTMGHDDTFGGLGGGNMEPGIVIDGGAVIRANGTYPVTVHGYLIPK